MEPEVEELFFSVSAVIKLDFYIVVDEDLVFRINFFGLFEFSDD